MQPPTILLSLGVEVSAIAQGTYPVLAIAVSSQALSSADAVEFALAVQASVGAFVDEPWSYNDVSIEMEMGDGQMVAIPKADRMDPVVTIAGSMQGGTREASFSIRGDGHSPLKSSLLRGMRRVRVTGIRGVPGSIASTVLLDGYLREASWEKTPPTSALVAQDFSLAHVDKLLFYSLEKSSGKTRYEVIVAVCSAHSIPLGVVSLPNTGGGNVVKEIAEAGTARVLDWLAQFVRAVGCGLRWTNDGLLNIERYDTKRKRAGVRTLRPRDIRSMRAIPPATNAPNVLRFTASINAYTGAPGIRTVTVPRQIKRAVYAPAVAVKKQNHVTGVITDVALTSEAVERDIEWIDVTQTWDGGTLLTETTLEYGWVAARACRRRQDAAGVISFNDQFDVYQYADGTWRDVPQEEWKLKRMTIRTRSFEPTQGTLVQERIDYVDNYAVMEEPVRFHNPLPTPTDTWLPAFISDTGEAWASGKERSVSEIHVISYRPSPANASQLGDTSNKISVTYPGYFVTEPLSGASYYTFGGAVTRYARLAGVSAAPYFTGRMVVTTYTAIDERSHREVVTAQQSFSSWFNVQPFLPLPPSSNRVVAGAVPLVETKTSFQTAQPTTLTFRDNVRIALAGNREIVATAQNDFCENDAEMAAAALEEARMFSPRFEIVTDVDMICREGDIVVIDHPEATWASVKMLIEQIETTVNTASGENSQTLTCRYDPPELQ